MTEMVVALIMFLNGNMIEHTYKEKMSDCLKSKRIAERVLPPLIKSLGNIAILKIVKCNSQVGSGSLPNELLPSFGISIKNKSNKRDGLFPIKLSKALRELPIPIISRIKGGSVILDLRCLEKENIFVEQFNSLKIKNYF